MCFLPMEIVRVFCIVLIIKYLCGRKISNLTNICCQSSQI